MTLLQSLISEPEIDIFKIIGSIFYFLVSIIGVFIIRTINSLQASIKENEAKTQSNKENIIKITGKVDSMEKSNNDKLDSILLTLKEVKSYMYKRFDKFDEEIKEIKHQ